MKAKELESKGTDKCVLIDVRPSKEFDEDHIKGAISIPVDDFTEEKFKSACEGSEDKQVVVICKSGKCAKEATAKLPEDMLKKVAVLEGGMEEWSLLGSEDKADNDVKDEPEEGGNCSLSMDSQILAGAGGLIVLSFLLSHVHYIFGYLTLIVAAGLIYCGLVGTCGTKELLAKMPWNQCSKKSAKSSDTEDCDKGG